MDEHSQPPSAEWRQVRPAQPSLGRRLETIRQRWRLITITTLAGLGLVIAYLAVTPNSYEATSRLLVKPLPTDEAIFASVGFITESNDPSLGVQTAVQLVDNPDVADAVADNLELDLDATEMLGLIEVEPIPQSYIVAITAAAESPEEAQDLANSFAEEAVNRRTQEVQRNATEVLPRLEVQLAQLPKGGEAAEGLAATISELRFLSEGNDPTLQVESEAELPESPVSPKPPLAI
ncbi:MAG TPA: Wzz/FepE/Etk N-terminal domain-containing protein, partial [Rubrobacter sp.]|nr:Wzz/FepE/Etk N-terminal domain-containing protein [Rubrobacter sp.]